MAEKGWNAFSIKQHLMHMPEQSATIPQMNKIMKKLRNIKLYESFNQTRFEGDYHGLDKRNEILFKEKMDGPNGFIVAYDDLGKSVKLYSDFVTNPGTDDGSLGIVEMNLYDRKINPKGIDKKENIEVIGSKKMTIRFESSLGKKEVCDQVFLFRAEGIWFEEPELYDMEGRMMTLIDYFPALNKELIKNAFESIWFTSMNPGEEVEETFSL